LFEAKKSNKEIVIDEFGTKAKLGNELVIPDINTEVGPSIFKLVYKLKKDPRVVAQLNQGSGS
jgi:hypothetical protein